MKKRVQRMSGGEDGIEGNDSEKGSKLNLLYQKNLGSEH